MCGGNKRFFFFGFSGQEFQLVLYINLKQISNYFLILLKKKIYKIFHK